MGEIADSMINGEFDYITGEYIGRPTGYPRTNERYGKQDGKGNNPKWGVTNWLNNNGMSDRQEQMNLLRKYVVGATDNDSKESLCLRVSQDFNAFKKWFAENTTTDSNAV